MRRNLNKLSIKHQSYKSQENSSNSNNAIHASQRGGQICVVKYMCHNIANMCIEFYCFWCAVTIYKVIIKISLSKINVTVNGIIKLIRLYHLTLHLPAGYASLDWLKFRSSKTRKDYRKNSLYCHVYESIYKGPIEFFLSKSTENK